MIDHDVRTQHNVGAYEAPTFEEMVLIGRKLGLVGGVEIVGRRIRLQLAGQTFVLSPDSAEAMLRGMLLGYFASITLDEKGEPLWR